MGVLNVTPDSFSDGGRWLDPDAAVAHGLALVAEGADVVDVGGESTRPGAEPVAEDEELRRVLPVIEALAPHVRVSIDTRRAAVAEAAVAAGATLVNDVSASLWPVAAAAGPGVGWVAMHMQGEPRTMQQAPAYDDVVAEVRAFLVERAERARAAGVDEVWIDPGHRVRQDGGPQPGPAAGDPDAGRHRLAGAGGHQPQGVPRAAHGRRAEHRRRPTTGWRRRWPPRCGPSTRGRPMVRVHDVRPTVQAARGSWSRLARCA